MALGRGEVQQQTQDGPMFRLLSLVVVLFSFPTSYALELNETQAAKLYVEKNLELTAQRFEIDISKAEEITAGLWANPSLFIDSQLNPFGDNWNQKNAGGPTQQDFILTVPVDVNGKRRQAVKVARIATSVTEAQFQAFIRDGVFQMLTTLYDFQRLKREHELLQEKEQLLERLVLTLEKRIGSSNSQPLIQSRARLAHEDVKLEIQKNRIDQNEVVNKLRVLFRLQNNEEIEPKLNFKSSISEKFLLEQLVENAKKKRPDFIALELLKTQLKEQQNLDVKNIFNDVGIQAGVTQQKGVGARPGDPGSASLPSAWSWIIGVTLPLPVNDRNQGNILQTKIRTNQVLVREKFMVETVSKDIDTSIKKIEITSLNLNRFKSGQLANAKIVRDSALRQFGTGATTLLEYLDAVDAYHVAIQKYLSAQYDLSTEYLNLKLLSGQEIVP